MCILRERARYVAKGRGLSPKPVRCPPDMEAVCKGTPDCPMIGTVRTDSGKQGRERIDGFIRRVNGKRFRSHRVVTFGYEQGK